MITDYVRKILDKLRSKLGGHPRYDKEELYRKLSEELHILYRWNIRSPCIPQWGSYYLNLKKKKIPYEVVYNVLDLDEIKEYMSKVDNSNSRLVGEIHISKEEIDDFLKNTRKELHN